MFYFLLATIAAYVDITPFGFFMPGDGVDEDE